MRSPRARPEATRVLNRVLRTSSPPLVRAACARCRRADVCSGDLTSEAFSAPTDSAPYSAPRALPISDETPARAVQDVQ